MMLDAQPDQGSEPLAAITVTAEATLEKVEGRRLTFTVSVNDNRGLVAAGRVTRVVVDRDRDQTLHATAMAALLEIEAALDRVESGTYGRCASCGEQIPSARLEAMPAATVCVTCKGGSLSRRRTAATTR